jgi:radical SAM/Cys-rich protein
VWPRKFLCHARVCSYRMDEIKHLKNNFSNPPRSLGSLKKFPEIRRRSTETIQVNLGYRCNQACSHCHVDAGPNRTEQMTLATLNLVFKYIDKWKIPILDLTGGAPELNPYFRRTVEQAVTRGIHVIDRCNLTILSEVGQKELARFLAENGVHVVASLPCHSKTNVDRQRGVGIFELSIEGIRKLNAQGYGVAGSGLELDLVYNPQGPSLPPDGEALTKEYKQVLAEYDVFFNRLVTITNMPINRFKHQLEREGLLNGYMDVLRSGFVEKNLNKVMCRALLSVSWDGHVFDCDFNQMLDLPLGAANRAIHLSELVDLPLLNSPIAVDTHCFGCTAGAGSSCSGALTD